MTAALRYSFNKKWPTQAFALSALFHTLVGFTNLVVRTVAKLRQKRWCIYTYFSVLLGTSSLLDVFAPGSRQVRVTTRPAVFFCKSAGVRRKTA